MAFLDRKGVFMPKALGIDLGSSSILIFERKKGIVLREPSVLAVERENGRIIAIGREAEQMLGRTPGSISALKPIKGGVISDYEMCREMLCVYMKKICAHRLTKPEVIFAVPASITQLEERALLDAGAAAGARRVFLVETALAAAIGAGLDFSRPEGRAILDIGGGSSDIAVLSLGGIVESASTRIGGESFDEALIRYLRKNRGILIGKRIAEEIKVQIGCILPRPEEKKIRIQGRDLNGSFIGDCEITSNETCLAFEEVGGRIIENIHSVLEKTPPELLVDINRDGITLAGGGSLLWGLDEYIHRYTGIKVHIADDCVSCVAFGLGKLAESLRSMAPGAIHLERKKLLLHLS